MKYNGIEIPHLAEMFFRPNEDWSKEEASQLFSKEVNIFSGIEQFTREPIPIDKIIYEDCIEGMKKLPSNFVQCIIADPPFGINFNSEHSSYNRIASNVNTGYKEITSDNYKSFTKKWIFQATRILNPTGSMYIFSSFNHLRHVLNAIHDSGLHLVSQLIYQYNFGVFRKRNFVIEHYPVCFVVKDPKNYYFNRIRHYQSSVMKYKRKYIKGKEKNATKLPLDLIRLFIGYSSRPADIVLDPFLGSGTSILACKQDYRHWIGYEVNIRQKKTISANLDHLKLGETYIPYSQRNKSPYELSKIDKTYYRAYEIYKSIIALIKEGDERTIAKYSPKLKVITE